MATLFAVAITACGEDPDLCERLGGAPSCGADAQNLCYSAIERQHRDTPHCREFLEALVQCAGELREVGCSGSMDAYANGDGQFVGPTNFAIVGGFSLVVNDTACSRVKNDYDACVGEQ